MLKMKLYNNKSYSSTKESEPVDLVFWCFLERNTLCHDFGRMWAAGLLFRLKTLIQIVSAAVPHMERIKCGLYNILNRLDFMDLSDLGPLSNPNTLTGYSAEHSHDQFHSHPRRS